MPVSESATKAWEEMNKMADKMAKEYGLSLELPPKSFKEMRAEFVEFEGGKKIVVKIPYDDRFANPMGIFQGGMLCTALDNTFGPLSYLAARRPCVTTDLSTQFFRTFFPKDEYVLIEAKVVSKSPAMMTMQAEVRNPKNKLIAIATSSVLILQESMLKRMTSKQEQED
ncbi:PaaI family thioesterase [Leptospira yasudae]|uniref:PaaI family thioesterase n=1 Tax=Leptospira yasudae TaxID=2202201 RepID=A0A5F2ECT6_9LEPT|nr:PaaI family thioesterase [Leptospira yasudae]RHX81297.1 PaaI family thioesterase [Leptospira yasudae]RHX96161.1 PaaI family thioesterase [Leptospira yasudae]TGK29979.1 PaaI family thioesterase [Leptospira yasudae]TGL80529.1 PaaI family thioesterase [Leptospira yasudae]TGL80956.1 PaaI family thioesterase [Leptospira yasudae]